LLNPLTVEVSELLSIRPHDLSVNCALFRRSDRLKSYVSGDLGSIGDGASDIILARIPESPCRGTDAPAGENYHWQSLKQYIREILKLLIFTYNNDFDFFI
jgi:hypothetical protein